EWETPWRLVGPVLADDRPPPAPPPVAPGTYPDWSASIPYERGSKVIRDGLGYEAKWWTLGNLPGADVANEWDTPWQPLFDQPC
ncbi:MAG: glycosyl hydrolase family 18, partial [Acidimicrobiia bacterium]